jgi:hypothetical protein
MVPRTEPLSVPYIASVWDLEHRKQPYFPEVSTTGWTWSARENVYNALLPRASMVITGTQAGKVKCCAITTSIPRTLWSFHFRPRTAL